MYNINCFFSRKDGCCTSGNCFSAALFQFCFCFSLLVCSTACAGVFLTQVTQEWWGKHVLFYRISFQAKTWGCWGCYPGIPRASRRWFAPTPCAPYNMKSSITLHVLQHCGCRRFKSTVQAAARNNKEASYVQPSSQWSIPGPRPSSSRSHATAVQGVIC